MYPQQTMRNLRLVLQREAGKSFEALGDEFEISAVRAFQIYNETLKRHGLPLLSKDERIHATLQALLNHGKDAEDLDPDTPAGFYYAEIAE